MYQDSRNEAEAKSLKEQLPPATVRQLVAGIEALEADLRRLRVRVSAPDRCEALLEELVRLQHGVERLALAIIHAHLEARLVTSDNVPRDVLALKTFLDGIAAAVRRVER